MATVVMTVSCADDQEAAHALAYFQGAVLNPASDVTSVSQVGHSLTVHLGDWVPPAGG